MPRRYLGTRIFRYDSFKGGEFGTLGQEKAPPNSFTGTNVLVYGTGLIGPRPGLKNITPQNQPNGVILGWAPTPTPGRDGIFIIGTTVYRFNLFDPATDTPFAFGSVPNSSGEIVFPKLATTTNIATTVSEGAVNIDQVNDVVTDLGSPSGHTHTVYGDQLILAENTSSRHILASALGSFSDWTGGYNFAIGDFWQVTALEPQRNNLVIFKRTGIHVLSGPVTNENTGLVIRKVLGLDGVLHPWHVARDSQDSLWFFQLFRDYPSVFAGSAVTSFNHLRFPTREEDLTAALPPVKRSVVGLQGQLTQDSQCFIQGGSSQSMFLHHNSIWTFHHFETPITAMARGVENNLVITDGGSVSTPAKFYSTRFDADRPAFTTDGLFGPGDGSNTPLAAEFTLPDFYNPDGRTIHVRALELTIKKWQTGVTTNTLTVDITTLGRTNGALDIANQTSTWSELGSASSVSGTHDRLVFPKECYPGLGWRVRVSGIVGVAVADITVEYTENYDQPRTRED